MPKERKPLGRDKSKSLTDALAKISADRDLRVASLNDFDLNVKAVSTGNIAIDSITGVGGLPRGRIIELYGPPSSGKTTTALQAAAVAQSEGETILYLDYEHALDPTYCQALGIDTSAESFLLAQPDTFEQGMNAMRELIETGEIGLVIVDSVAAMVIEKELSIETGGSTFADKAKLMAQTMRQLTPIVQKYDVVCVFLNHLQDVIDASPIGQKLAASGVKRTTTPGGKALKFHASLRMEYKPIGNIRSKGFDELTNEKDDVVSGQKVQVTCTKNKVAPPFKTCEVRVRFGKGFSQAWSALNLLVSYNVVKKRPGGYYDFKKVGDANLTPEGQSEWSSQGEDNVVSLIEMTPAWEDRLVEYARGLIDQHGVEQIEIAEDEDEEDPELIDA
jgi:recombination protein RecA